jgi:hypothetical protein
VKTASAPIDNETVQMVGSDQTRLITLGGAGDCRRALSVTEALLDLAPTTCMEAAQTDIGRNVANLWGHARMVSQAEISEEVGLMVASRALVGG